MLTAKEHELGDSIRHAAEWTRSRQIRWSASRTHVRGAKSFALKIAGSCDAAAELIAMEEEGGSGIPAGTREVAISAHPVRWIVETD